MSDPDQRTPDPGQAAPDPDRAAPEASPRPPGPSLPPPNAQTRVDAMAPPPGEVRSDLSDGEWHRMHPLTPLFRGGLVLVIVAGVVIANLRDRLIAILLPIVAPGSDVEYDEYQGDPVSLVMENNLYVPVLLGILGLLIVIVAVMFVSWRFHTFRVTKEAVEVRSGVVFRTHRRAPLDRIQGVNLTRPMLARLCGMAKLEVVGAGADANVKLEYLSTSNSETIRDDILRLASGRQLAESGAGAGRPLAQSESGAGHGAIGTFSTGVTGLIDGVDAAGLDPDHIVRVPSGRVIASTFLSFSTLWLIALLVFAIVGAMLWDPWIIVGMIPAVLAFGAYWVGQIFRSLRFSAASTPQGLQLTFGLTTTVTEKLPPGRIHAIRIRQSLFWRPAGWWAMNVNRVSGGGSNANEMIQRAIILPVGRREDVERVLSFILADASPDTMATMFDRGVLGSSRDEGDPFGTTPRRARWLRPLSWRRNGVFVTPSAVLIRKGVISRSLTVVPLARLQSVRIEQGPVARPLAIAGLTVHTVPGVITAAIWVQDRARLLEQWDATVTGAITAAAADRSHRWAADPLPVVTAAPPATASAPSPPGVPE